MPERSKPLPGRQVSTHFLRVPLVDWPAITQGHKTELRTVGRHAKLATILQPPTPIVGYAMRRFRPEAESTLLVVEDAWQEPLGSISPESLRNEGFESLAEFRTYWRLHRTRQAWKPLMTVHVLRLRPWTPDDDRAQADRLLRRLYGRWLDGEE